ncbi:DUF1203 domain-containing protein [Microbulbifer sp. THAF38]|uniref:DUF1203 domain-containing protein n=1 Tax=Microbulbifer sp. THAF38 TaxID=2587856 RepID=UPI001C12B361|nr:DUF1203 domain-containing protein [Microbulbifer sp. THAF38]
MINQVAVTMAFQIQGINPLNFYHLLILPDAQLKEKNACWKLVDASPGYPCRVSLVDAKAGERVLCLPYSHHNTSSFYRASGPIFIREHAEPAKLDTNEVPLMLRHRLLSIRAYNCEGLMETAEVAQGADLEGVLEKQFSLGSVEYIHIHNALPGCFNCAVYRA